MKMKGVSQVAASLSKNLWVGFEEVKLPETYSKNNAPDSKIYIRGLLSARRRKRMKRRLEMMVKLKVQVAEHPYQYLISLW
jgi:hypothetical protein